MTVTGGAYLGTQLRDPSGTVWHRRGWITARDAGRLIRRGVPVFRYTLDGDPVEVVDPDVVRVLWSRVEDHLVVPGTAAQEEPDADGLTYGAHRWRSGDRLALGLKTFC